jgi:hypothetical protein
MKRLYPLDKAILVYLCFLRLMWNIEKQDPVCESVPLGIPVYAERERRVRVRATTNKILNLSINSESTKGLIE